MPKTKQQNKEQKEVDKPKHPGGRPTDYKPEYCEQAENYALLGATDVQMAGFFGVCEATITNWKRDKPEFLAAIKRGKEDADAQVVKSLFKRAMGYKHEAVKIFADAKTGAEQIVPYIEHYPPDTAACIFWLKNRQKSQWRDKQDHEVSGANGKPIETVNYNVDLPPEEAYKKMLGLV